MKNKLHPIFGTIVLFVVILAAGNASAAEVKGAGATFPAPIYQKWATKYRSKGDADFRLYYQGIGSGAAIQQVVSKFVDFGASDVPMSAEEVTAKGLTQFPTVVGGIVPVVNIPGIAPGQLRMSGEVLADIYLGKITHWNDPRIMAENKSMALPDQAIAVVNRVDESGIAFIFTSYLAQVSADWRRSVGAGKSVNWPVGVGGKGNDGAATYVHRLQGSIGFVEYVTVKQSGLAYVQLKNRDGRFVAPSEASLKAAASHATWDPAKAFGESLINQPGEDSWPLTMTTYALLNNVQASPERGKAVLAFFDWGLSVGTRCVNSLGYVPLPENVSNMVREALKVRVKDAAGNALWR